MFSFRRNLYLVFYCIAGFGLIISGCSHEVTNSPDEVILYQDGDFVIGRSPPPELDPELAKAVSQAVNKYTVLPDVADCTELAQWYVNGLEVVLQGEILEILRANSSIDIALQSLPRVSSALRDKMVNTLRQNDRLCPREPDFDYSILEISELKPLAREALNLMERTGVYFSIDAPTVLRLAIDIAEGRPLVFEVRGPD